MGLEVRLLGGFGVVAEGRPVSLALLGELAAREGNDDRARALAERALTLVLEPAAISRAGRQR